MDLTSKATYPSNTTFGKRILESKSDKVAVARYVALTLVAAGLSILVLDGSSTFYLVLALIEKRAGFKVYTNSIAVAVEYALCNMNGYPRQFLLELLGGEVNPVLMMTAGADCEARVAERARKAQITILSVRFLFGSRGPAGWEHDSLAIKQAAVKNTRRLILIADWRKLSEAYQEGIPLIYDSPAAWTEVMSRTRPSW